MTEKEILELPKKYNEKKRYTVYTPYDLKNIVETLVEHNPKVNLNFLDITPVHDLSGLFEGSKFNGDISKWDFSHVLKADNMFAESEFDGHGLEKANFKKLVSAYGMFYNSKFNAAVDWDMPQLRIADYMFARTPLKKKINLKMPNIWTLDNFMYGTDYPYDLSDLDKYINPEKNKEKIKEFRQFLETLYQFDHEFGEYWVGEDEPIELPEDTPNAQDLIEEADEMMGHLMVDGVDLYQYYRNYDIFGSINDPEKQNIIIDNLCPSQGITTEPEWRSYVNFMSELKNKTLPYPNERGGAMIMKEQLDSMLKVMTPELIPTRIANQIAEGNLDLKKAVYADLC